ncbi:MAG: ABC transporter permease [Gammaproteobacteria bacterium]|nr:ABC transporter permease [Gammaproteobacteria bacterium]
MYPRWLWQLCALPGVVWLLLLFVVPFYAVIGVAFGDLDPIFQNPIPIWNPLDWNFENAFETLSRFTPGQPYWSVFARTTIYIVFAVGISLLIAYPVAYYISRHARRTKTLLLVLLVLPFWISYLMRMLAWVGLLAPDGFVNQFLISTHIDTDPPNWLGGHAGTVVFALVYGYIPYMILPLVAALDRIDQNLIEAARDLGLNSYQAFFRVTFPLSRMGILGGCVIITLPMFGDYYTTQIVSGSPRTTMLGNQIYLYFHGGPQPDVGAMMTLVLSIFLGILMAYYLYSVARAQRALQ